MKFRTKAIHIGNERCKTTGAVVPPIHLASTYVQDVPGEWGDYDYSKWEPHSGQYGNNTGSLGKWHRRPRLF